MAAFIAYPIDVASLLRGDGQPDEMIVAGLLHDVLEKTATTSAELRRRFGAQIARRIDRSQTTHRSAITSPANGSCVTASGASKPAGHDPRSAVIVGALFLSVRHVRPVAAVFEFDRDALPGIELRGVCRVS